MRRVERRGRGARVTPGIAMQRARIGHSHEITVADRPRRRCRSVVLVVGVPLEGDAAERAEIEVEGRAVQLAEPALDALETGLRAPHARRHAAERRNAVEEIERLLIGLGRARQVIALLRHAAQVARALPQRVAPIHVAARQLRGLALAGV